METNKTSPTNMTRGNRLCLILLLTFLGHACQNHSNDFEHKSVPMGAFMGIEPTHSPLLLFPDWINSAMGEYNGTFIPDGTMFFYTISNIYHDAMAFTEMNEDGSWTKPEIAPFSVKHSEFDPIFSPDGNALYYSSHRPNPSGSTENSNIWKVERNEGVWATPQMISLTGPRPGNYYSSLTREGHIYFNIWNTGNMFKAIPVDTGYVVTSLGEIVNSTSGDGDPFIAPDESYLIFRSTRSGGLGSGDLWITFQSNGTWTEPMNLGEPINSKYHEMCPYVTTDGKLFIFSSGRFSTSYFDESIEDIDDVKSKLKTWDNGQQNIYSMSSSFIEEFRVKAFGSLDERD